MYVSLEWDLKLELSLNSPSGFQNALNHSLCHCCLFMYIFIYICIETHSDRQTDRQRDRQTDRQTDKKTDRSFKVFFCSFRWPENSIITRSNNTRIKWGNKIFSSVSNICFLVKKWSNTLATADKLFECVWPFRGVSS